MRRVRPRQPAICEKSFCLGPRFAAALILAARAWARSLRASTPFSRIQEDILQTTNLYRSIVSDLFDPYMTLLVASHQFIEGRGAPF